MAAGKELFTDRKSLRAWLKGKPDGVAEAIATRALLRVMAEPWQSQAPETKSDFEVQGTVYRATFVCWVALRFGRKDMEEQIAGAYQVANDLAAKLTSTAKRIRATPESALVHVAVNASASFMIDPSQRAADAVVGARNLISISPEPENGVQQIEQKIQRGLVAPKLQAV